MSTNHHTDIISGAPATAATFNDPLGELDTAITHTNSEYYGTSIDTLTMTTSGTDYPFTSFEIAFTPAYSGQVFLVMWQAGNVRVDTAGTLTLWVSIVDGSNNYVFEGFLMGRDTIAAANDYTSMSAVRAWTASSDDVGETRKAKVYARFDSDGAVLTLGRRFIGVVTH